MIVIYNDLIIKEICMKSFNKCPDDIKRFEMGYGNYVYETCVGKERFVIRINSDENAYKDTVYWLNKLKDLQIPIPKIIHKGKYDKVSYIILNYIPGDDLGNVYTDLSYKEKRDIAEAIVAIQNSVATLPQNCGYGYLTSYGDQNYKNSWKEVILEHLNRSRDRIVENGIFDGKKVDNIKKLLERYDFYFDSIKPVPFLDDLSTKNVLVYEGKLSGVIDIDWICFGDRIYYVGLTNMALKSMKCDTIYIDFLAEEMALNEIQREVLTLYTLIFCVDFMGEKGMRFNDKIVKVNKNEIEMLNNIYEDLYNSLLY